MEQKIDIIQNLSLQEFNTFGVNYKTKYYCSVENVDYFYEIINKKEIDRIPILILGSGSNILFTKDFDGLVIQYTGKKIKILKQDLKSIYINVEAGMNWHSFVEYCVQRGYGGVENLSLIPGSIGATPVSNIGAYGVEVADIIEEVIAIDLETRGTKVMKNPDCVFSYRDSIFKQKKNYLIISVTFKLQKYPKLTLSHNEIIKELELRSIKNPSLSDISNIIIDIRTSKLPDLKTFPNAGSFFKNPVVSAEKFETMLKMNDKIPGYVTIKKDVKLSAAWFIENCGWKGKKIGNVGVSQIHSLVLVKYRGGTGEELHYLSKKIQEDVLAKWGIFLSPEVEIL